MLLFLVTQEKLVCLGIDGKFLKRSDELETAGVTVSGTLIFGLNEVGGESVANLGFLAELFVSESRSGPLFLLGLGGSANWRTISGHTEVDSTKLCLVVIWSSLTNESVLLEETSLKLQRQAFHFSTFWGCS